MSDLGRILVVIPTYDESGNVESTVGRLRAAVPAAHVLIVDDNSPDGTGQIADGLASRDGMIHVLHRPAKEGLAAAYLAGFAWGLDQGYDVIAEMDADGSHQPEQLPDLLEALARADMVKGSRWMRGGSVVDWDAKRKLLSQGANVWVQAVMDLPVHDSTGGYNVYRADILRRIDLDSMTSRGYAFQIDMTRQVLEAGGVVAEVPIEFQERASGESKMSGDIVKEALLKTAGWGAKRRLEEVKVLAGGLADRAAPLVAKAKDQVGEVPMRSDELKSRVTEAAARIPVVGKRFERPAADDLSVVD